MISDLVALGGLLTGLLSVGTVLWQAVAKRSADRRQEEQDRTDRLEERLDKLEVEVDAEREKRRATEKRLHQIVLALDMPIRWMEEVNTWILEGAKPPPPVPLPLTILSDAREALGYQPREPPA